MYHVKLYNKISKVGLDDLDPAKYAYGEEMAEYDAVLVRSAKLHDVHGESEVHRARGRGREQYPGGALRFRGHRGL